MSLTTENFIKLIDKLYAGPTDKELKRQLKWNTVMNIATRYQIAFETGDKNIETMAHEDFYRNYNDIISVLILPEALKKYFDEKHNDWLKAKEGNNV